MGDDEWPKILKLDEEAWDRFQAALDAPPEPNEKLKALMRNGAPWTRDRIAELEAENARLREALQFYADDQNYRLNGALDPNGSWFIGSDKARVALARPAASGDAT